MTERSAAPGIRLQKVLAQAGVASRRAAERLIEAGRVRVDGRIARELGVRVDPRNARVEVDGKRIVAEPLVYVVLNKPRGVVCTLSDPEGRPTVAELLRGAGARVVPVGRLDFNTGGALLCTNDGEFANRVAHPRHHAPKEYLVKVDRAIDAKGLETFRESITIGGRATRPAEVELVRIEGDKSWLAVRLEEGRNRQVRRLAEHAGFIVMRLVRTAHAGITVEGVPPGRFRSLTVEELTQMRDEYGVPKRIRRPLDVPAERPSGQRPRERSSGKSPRERSSGQRPRERPSGQRPYERPSERPRERPSGQRSYERTSERQRERPSGQRSYERPSERPRERPSGQRSYERTSERQRERPSGQRPHERTSERQRERPSGRRPHEWASEQRPNERPSGERQRERPSGQRPRGRGFGQRIR